MNEVFADTFYWIALLNPDDAYHELAIEAAAEDHLVTTWAVQIEVMDALCEQRLRPLATGFWQATTDDPSLTVVPLDRALLRRSADLFAERPDKNWSLTGCISFEVLSLRMKSCAKRSRFHRYSSYVPDWPGWARTGNSFGTHGRSPL